MSINVTVSGNPVRINRGKMVTSYDPAKAEFAKRRLMRFEQVRQQSKDIAEDVRNKVKTQKEKCLCNVEKEGEAQLKNWQARKLLELQNQYQHALDEIGLGHKSAAFVEDEEESLMEKQESDERVAKERGRAAAERLQIKRNEANLKKAVPIQRKKITRDLENVRSNVVAHSRKSKKSPVKRLKGSFDSDAENRVPELVGLEESDSQNSSEEDLIRARKLAKEQQTTAKVSKEQQTSSTDLKVPTSDKAAQTQTHSLQEISQVSPPKEFSLDTRITERIRRRVGMNLEPDYCDLAEKTLYPRSVVCPCCKCHGENFNVIPEDVRKTSSLTKTVEKSDQDFQIKKPETEKIEPEKLQPQKSEDKISQPQNEEDEVSKTSKTEPEDRNFSKTSSKKTLPRHEPLKKKPEPKSKSTIPPKPKITLRPVKDRPAYIGTDPQTQPVQYYDHPNRYSRAYQSGSHVDKIDDEELVISPNILSEEEIKEKMRKRDIEAHLRGQAALEKERIQREYHELLKKLPVLQKQERILDIGADKEKYHMSRERLEDLEKKRQNRLDNAYEELFVRRRPPVVTLHKRREDPEPQSLNLASWDVDFDPDKNSRRSEELSRLLSDLKSQKDDLLKEIESTLPKEQLAKVSFDDIKSKSTDYSRVKTKRKRKDSRPFSPTTTEIGEESTKSKSTKKGTTVSSISSSPSPRKKRKIKPTKKIILQNTSTQTTPKIEAQSAATSPITFPTSTGTSTAPDGTTCSCKTGQDDLCDIVIKIKDNEEPEVQVYPPFLAKSVRVVAEDVEAKDETSKKSGSWQEQFTQNSTSRSSITSYFDPPSTGRSDKQKKVSKKVKSPGENSRSTASSPGDRTLDPRLLTYIKKLLSMSKASIDNLTVSDPSGVSTPTQSIIDTPTNNPIAQLRNVMKYFNLDAAELQKQLSYSSNGSSKHYNTSESIAVSSISDMDKTQYQSCTDFQSCKTDSSKVLADIKTKISSLTKMIEQVREEKKKMMESSTSSSDRDLTTTSYKDLPDKKPEEDKSNSLDTDKLLEIDQNYAKELQKLSADEIRAQRELVEDDELLNRLKRLLDDKNKKESPKDKSERTVVTVTKAHLVHDKGHKPIAVTSEVKAVQESKEGRSVGAASEKTTVTFKVPEPPKDTSPLFLDIPKLPKLEAPSVLKKKRPPPTKALRAITGNVPHELSTIVEADSQLSTKLESPTKKSTSSSKSADAPDASQKENSSDDISEMEAMESMLISIGMEWAIPTLKKTREALAMASSSSGSGSKESPSLREFLSKISSNSEESTLSESQGMSLIQADNRKTSTPVPDKERKEGPPFLTDSDLSSVRDHSGRGKDSEKFYELNEESQSR